MYLECISTLPLSWILRSRLPNLSYVEIEKKIENVQPKSFGKNIWWLILGTKAHGLLLHYYHIHEQNNNIFSHVWYTCGVPG